MRAAHPDLTKGPDRLKRRSWLVVWAGLLLVVYATLFPFDFFVQSGTSWREVWRGFDWTLTEAYALADIPQNILLFMPFGFGLGGVLLARRWRFWPAWGLTLWVGLGLSGLLEVVQAVALLRFPAAADVLANGLGTAVGCAMFYGWGRRIWAGVDWLAQRIRPYLTPRRFLVICLLYLAAWWVLSIWLQTTTRLSHWDNQFPLIVGNEQTQDRPWRGTLARLYLADRAFTADEVARGLAGESALSVGGGSLGANYDFATAGETNFPPLVTQGGGAIMITPDGVALSEDGWLASDGAVTAVSQALSTTSQFTLGLTAASGNLAQDGPARLMSISGDPYQRNLTVGQEGTALVLRFRTPLTGENGRTPELIIPGVFTDGAMREILVTYDGTAVRLSLDAPTNVYAIELVPAVALFIKTFPKEVGQMRLSRGNTAVFRLLYTICLFLPWAYWLALLDQPKHSRHPWFVFGLMVGVVLPAVVWETLLHFSLRNYPWRPVYVMLNGVIITAVFLLFSWRQQRLVGLIPPMPAK